jgi:hypothetical protein
MSVWVNIKSGAEIVAALATEVLGLWFRAFQPNSQIRLQFGSPMLRKK